MTTSPMTFSDDESTIATPRADTIAFVARVLLTLPFLRSGLSKIVEFDATADASLVVIGAIVLQVAGGLAVLAGYRARVGALLLMLFLIPATIVVLPGDRTAFFNNLGLLGGLAMVAAYGSGAISVDAKVEMGSDPIST
jgi:putative oxidoreductase